MEGYENKLHLGMNCSLDELIRKEAPKRLNSKVVRKSDRSRNIVKNKKMGNNRNFKGKANDRGIQKYFNKNNAHFNKGKYIKEIKAQSNDKRKDFQMKVELESNSNFPDKNHEISNVSERNRIVKMIRLEHRDEDFTMQVLLDVNPIIIVNKITGVIQLNSYNCRSSNMLEIWNLLLKPLGLCLQATEKDGDSTNWSITDGSCYMESFKDGMIVRGSGSRDTARNARFSILEQHIKQLII